MRLPPVLSLPGPTLDVLLARALFPLLFRSQSDRLLFLVTESVSWRSGAGGDRGVGDSVS